MRLTLGDIPSQTRWAQLSLATVFMFLNGSFFSFSVFGEAVEKSSVVPGALDGVWSAAMALMSLVAIPFTIYAGYVLHEGVTPSRTDSAPFGKSKTDRLRILSTLSALCILTMLFAGMGIKRSIPSWITFAVAMQGLPFNTWFVLASECLAAWSPQNPGLAVGCGQLFSGLGSIVFAALYELLIERLGCIGALYLTTALLTSLSATASVFLQWPPVSVSEFTEPELASDAQGQKRITWRRLPLMPLFWLFVYVIVTFQTGFVFIPYFFKMGFIGFGRPIHVLVNVFEVMFLVATLARPFAGILADVFKYGHGRFSIASKNTAAMLLLVQTGIFLMLIPITSQGYFTGFITCVCLMLVIFASGECVVAILARDLFGPENSSFVFCAGAILGFGVGEYLPTKLMSVVIASSPGGSSSLSMFTPFYIMCALWSAAGLVCSLVMTRRREAFQGGTFSDNRDWLSVINDAHVSRKNQMVTDRKINLSNYGATERISYPAIV